VAFTAEERIEQLELICDSIKDRAYEIIKEMPMFNSIEIHIDMQCHEVPTIRIETLAYPHKLVEKWQNNLESK